MSMTTTLLGGRGGDGTQDRLLSDTVYSTINSGKIAVIPNFLSETDLLPLRMDAQNLWADQRFSTDALASYGSTGTFDPTKDRSVLRLPQWKNDQLGNFSLRQKLGTLMGQVRRELAVALHRPNLNQGAAITTRYGYGSTEISYTRFGPGAFLQRHVDEHHEELKGVAGWSKPTRRSISWLIYLNGPDWKVSSHNGGQLRCFERRHSLQGRIGAMDNGDLQIGWLRATAQDPVERPVYLDSKTHLQGHGPSSLYVVLNDEGDGAIVFTGNERRRTYISKSFETSPIMYVQGSEALMKRLIISKSSSSSDDWADRFHLIEQPKSKLEALSLKFSKQAPYSGKGEDPYDDDEQLLDVDPLGGTLVLFDSVSLPHEVLATKNRERWACSGWFHEDQQPVEPGA